MKRRLALGLDSSTQGISLALVDIDRREKVCEHSLDYVRDKRLDGFGISARDYILPPGNEGEADQPPALYFASLDAILDDLRNAGIGMADIAVANVSAQQHGHVYLNRCASSIFAGLCREEADSSDLVTLLEGCLAYERAPIWMTADTAEQARNIRKNVGGKEAVIRLSGSDAPLRFTGVIIRKIAEQYPEVYERTEGIQLLSSLIVAVLTGNAKIPVDFGNACGTSLMNYRRRRWSRRLIEAAADGLPGGRTGLKKKLPSLVAPDTILSNIAVYFVRKYNFSPACRVVAGSGDNPQSKVLVSGDLLSLGTSLVNMVTTDGKTLDGNGFACAMYDGLGRPFMFGCRTNGALVWDQLRARYGMKKGDFGPAEKALREIPVARHLVFWQPRSESFPPSGSFKLVRISRETGSFGADYAGLIESTLAAIYHHSKGFTAETAEPLFVTGGAAASHGILRRLAAIWKREIIPVDEGGASLGAAVAGASAFLKSQGETVDVREFSAAFLKRGDMVSPRADDIAAYHGVGGYLERFAAEEARLITAHPG